MPTYNAILKEIRKAVKKFNRNIPQAQRDMFDAISEEITRLDLYDDGRVRTTAKNLSILASIKNKMLKVIVTPEYRASVKEFVASFNDITKLQNAYWKEQEADFKPRKILTALRKQAITDTVSKLTESGIGVNVGERITEMLKASITTGGSYKKLTASLRDGLLNTEQKGYLDRYAKTVSITGLNQYSRQYNNIIASDLGYVWYKYDNTDIETTRPFCDALTDQPYFHVSELPRILRCEGLYYMKDGVKTKVPINPKTGLWAGAITGTNTETFFVNAGGWNCGHQIRPVNEKQVPQEVKDRVLAITAEGSIRLAQHASKFKTADEFIKSINSRNTDYDVVQFHGTQSTTLNNPSLSEGRYGKGFYMTPGYRAAEMFGKETRTGISREQIYDSANVFSFDMRGLKIKVSDSGRIYDIDTLKKSGYDAVYYKDVGETVVFNKSKIKQFDLSEFFTQAKAANKTKL